MDLSIADILTVERSTDGALGQLFEPLLNEATGETSSK